MANIRTSTTKHRTISNELGRKRKLRADSKLPQCAVTSGPGSKAPVVRLRISVARAARGVGRLSDALANRDARFTRPANPNLEKISQKGRNTLRCARGAAAEDGWSARGHERSIGFFLYQFKAETTTCLLSDPVVRCTPWP